MPVPYVQPTPATFKARFPEFTAVSDATIQFALDDAFDQVGDSWLERDRARAQMLLAAHILTMAGEPGRTNTGNNGASTGFVKRRKVGDVETEFGSSGSSSSGGSGASWYALTSYGLQFLDLLRKNFPAVAVV